MSTLRKRAVEHARSCRAAGCGAHSTFNHVDMDGIRRRRDGGHVGAECECTQMSREVEGAGLPNVEAPKDYSMLYAGRERARTGMAVFRVSARLDKE